jgi:Zn ribbon nucleic-acid-binding protein
MMNVQATTLWRSITHLWCRHRDTIVTPKTDGMPAHLECVRCGWREPVLSAAPRGVRTWDSSRDEARYEREKKRRAQLEEQRLIAMAQLSVPQSRMTRPRRARRGNIVELRRASGA